MKKTLILLGLLLSATSSFATISQMNCSNPVANIQVSIYQSDEESSKSINKSVFSVTSYGFTGPVKSEFDMSTLDVSTDSTVEISNKVRQSQTLCNKVQKTSISTFVAEFTVSKKDGKSFYAVDAGEAPKTIVESLFCVKTVTDSWPCN